MQYRELGKTGRKISVIGLGGEHLDGKPYGQVRETVGAALEQGINIMDVFMPGQEIRENIAKALGSRRKDVMVQGHIGSAERNGQYDIVRELPVVQKYFEELLRIFGGHIEFGMMFFIDTDKDFDGVFSTGFAEYVRKLKQQGDIGHIGFSSHNPETAMRVINTGLPELMLFSINLAFDLSPADTYVLAQLQQGFDAAAFRGLDPKRQALYKLCAQKGVGITVMKTLGAGKLLSAEHAPFKKPMTPGQCIHYALTRPAVASTLVGCTTRSEVLDAVRYLELSDAERDYTSVLDTLQGDFAGNCVYCGHCSPCPAEIDIAAVTKYLDIARLDPENIPPSIRAHYAALTRGGADCVGCGSCESRCPFGVRISDNMTEAGRLFT